MESEFILPALPTLAPSTSSQLSAGPSDLIKSPTKRLNERLQDPGPPPESPDMKFARDRLGNLLTSIRKGDVPLVVTEKPEPDGVVLKRAPGRPRKSVLNYSKTNPGEILFEMRGKPFSLREDRTSCTEYQLCRAWMRGSLKDDEPPVVIPEDPSSPLPSNVPMSLLIGRDITSLPRATSPYLVKKEWPDQDELDVFDKSVNFEDVTKLKQEYARHWKSVKKSINSHTRLRARRYQRSTDLLNAIYNAASQVQ